MVERSNSSLFFKFEVLYDILIKMISQEVPRLPSVILVVDDEEDLRETLAEFLTEQGYSVLTAPDGLAAKKILITQKIDLVLTDIRMPNMNGVDLLKFSKALPDAPKVIVITGFSDYSREQVESLGASAFLNKPFDLDKLLSTVKGLAIEL